MDEFDELVGTERSVMVSTPNGAQHKIVVEEVLMKTLKPFAQACAPFLREFDEAGALAIRVVDGVERPMEEFALFKVISEHGEAMCAAAALVSNADADFYGRLKPDQFFKVAALVIEVNGNFFVQSLAPQLIRFARAMSLVGTMLFQASSQQATGLRT